MIIDEISEKESILSTSNPSNHSYKKKKIKTIKKFNTK